MDNIGGFEQTVPTQATVKTLSLPSKFLQVTNTTGTGFKTTLPFKFLFFISI